MAHAADQQREASKRDIPRRERMNEDQASARRPTSIEHILVCLDRSPLSEACVPPAVALARVFDAKVTLLHVMQAATTTSLSTPDPLGWEIARQEAQAYLDRLQGRTAAPGLTARTMLAQGFPAARIVSAAAEIGADLIVLGTHGETTRGGEALGSTAQQVLASTRRSVFVPRSSLKANGEVAPKRILVPLDGSTRTESVLPTAVRIARGHGAELVLAHVVPEPVRNAILSAEDLERARDLARRLQSGAKRYLDQVASMVAHDDLPVRTVVLRERDERQSLLELSEREQIDLMIVSAHGVTCNPARSFGSVASYLLSHARPALLVIQDLRDDQQTSDAVLDERHATPLRGTPHTGPAEGT
jgi:nucleotide-binding universal stress UspA family protein